MDLVNATLDTRSLFRHAYAEEIPGEYTLSINAEFLPDGVYSVKTYELVGDLEIEAGEDYIFRVQDGKQVSGVDFGKIKINHDTGGKDSLRYLESNGNAVDSATITVYLSSEYVQGNFANPIAKTTTDPSGRWITPISLHPGATYTVVFQKSGYFGPDSEEVIL